MNSDNQYKMFVDGQWASPNGTFADYNPSTGEVWADVSNGNRADTKVAIEAAAEAQPGWAALPHPERAKYLLKAADIMEAQAKSIADKIVGEAGGWIGKGMFETGYVPVFFGLRRPRFTK